MGISTIRTITTNSPEDTMRFAVCLGKGLERGDFIALEGDMGAGKTLFAKGLALGLDVKNYVYVNSPTFVVLKEYYGRERIYHFDVYRLDLRSFCETIDYRIFFYNSGVTIVEWADKIRELFPEDYLEIKIFCDEGNDKRRIEFVTGSADFIDIVKKIPDS